MSVYCERSTSTGRTIASSCSTGGTASSHCVQARRCELPTRTRKTTTSNSSCRVPAEGLNEDEFALFDLLKKDDLAKAERERVKQASRNLLASIKARLTELDRFWEKEQTKADVEVFILDGVYAGLPTPPFTVEEKKAVAAEVYAHVWQQAISGVFARGGVMSRRITSALYRRQPKSIHSGRPTPLDLFEVHQNRLAGVERLGLSLSCGRSRS